MCPGLPFQIVLQPAQPLTHSFGRLTGPPPRSPSRDVCSMDSLTCALLAAQPPSLQPVDLPTLSPPSVQLVQQYDRAVSSALQQVLRLQALLLPLPSAPAAAGAPCAAGSSGRTSTAHACPALAQDSGSAVLPAALRCTSPQLPGSSHSWATPSEEGKPQGAAAQLPAWQVQLGEQLEGLRLRLAATRDQLRSLAAARASRSLDLQQGVLAAGAPAAANVACTNAPCRRRVGSLVASHAPQSPDVQHTSSLAAARTSPQLLSLRRSSSVMASPAPQSPRTVQHLWGSCSRRCATVPEPRALVEPVQLEVSAAARACWN